MRKTQHQQVRSRPRTSAAGRWLLAAGQGEGSGRCEHAGNFPQAFTHLALIDSAITLDARLDQKEKPQRRSHAGLAGAASRRLACRRRWAARRHW